MIHPIIDEYYNHSPSYTRSNNFAVSKGLVSNAPGATQSLTPGNAGNTEFHAEEGEKELGERLEGVKMGMA